MALYRDQAVVIRTQKLGEADRIVTLFSRQRGRIRAVAKGVRRTKSKFGARLEPASYVDIQLYTGKTFDVVTQVEAIENYGDVISGDYQRWTIASAILETAERFTNNEGEPALQQFLLLTGALKSLAHQSHDPSLILDAYLPAEVQRGQGRRQRWADPEAANKRQRIVVFETLSRSRRKVSSPACETWLPARHPAAMLGIL